MSLTFDMEDWADGDVVYASVLNSNLGLNMAFNITAALNDIRTAGFDVDGNSQVDPQPNFIYDIFSSTTNINTTLTTAFLTGRGYAALNLYDDFEDGTVDGARWTTTGSVTESSGKMNLNDGDTATSVTNFYSTGYVAFFAKLTVSGVGGAAEILVTDGTSSLPVFSQAVFISEDYFFEFVQLSGTTWRVYQDGIYITTFDTSVFTPTSTLKVKFNTVLGGGGGGSIEVYEMASKSTVAISKQIVTTGRSMYKASTLFASYATINSASDVTLTIEISDDGVTWVTPTGLGNLTTLPSTSMVYHRITIASTTGATIPRIRSYGTLFE